MLSGAASRAICANHAAPACNNAAPVATTHHKATGVAVRRSNVSLKPESLQPTSCSSNLKWWLYRLIATRLLFFLHRSRQNFYFCFKMIEKLALLGNSRLLGDGACVMNFLILVHHFSFFQAQPAVPSAPTTQHQLASTQHRWQQRTTSLQELLCDVQTLV